MKTPFRGRQIEDVADNDAEKDEERKIFSSRRA